MRPWLTYALTIYALARVVLPAADVAASIAALTNVTSILTLPTERASAELPVHLTAAVTYVDPASGILFVEDETGGIFVSTRHSIPALRRGESIEIRGNSDAGLHLPGISRATIRPVGRLHRLTAARPAFSEIVQGKYDCRFVEVRGVVRQIGANRGRVSLVLETADGPPIEATFLNLTRTNLWDATVRIRGVCGLRGMKGGRILSVILYCWSNEALTIEKRGLANPFEAPRVSPADLRTNDITQRVRFDGRITRMLPGGFSIVQDDYGHEIELEARPSLLLKTNDRVQVSAVPAKANGQLALRHVELRTVAASRPQTANRAFSPDVAPLITRVAEIRRLGEDAAAGFPVRLRCIVTYYDREWMLFVQDETAGIYVHPGSQKYDLRPGDWVEVEGFTHSGDYAPVVVQGHFTVVDQATLPIARILSPEVLFRGQHDSMRVDISGVVHSVRAGKANTAQLELSTSAGRVTTHVLLDSTNLPLNLVDAEVRVRGVCGSTFNQRRQFLGPVLYAASTNDIIIDRVAPVDPFAIEAQPIASLLKFDSASMHRAKVAGAVTFVNAAEGTLFVQDATGGVFVRAKELSGVNSGQAVAALGFPVTSGYTPALVEASVRVEGEVPSPVARPISAGEAVSGRHDGELVIMKARLLDRFVRGSNDVLVLKAENATFEAQMPHAANSTWLQRLEPRSMLKLSGVCVGLLNPTTDPHAFKLLLRAPTDVAVLSTPPFWNDHRVRTVALWAAALVILPVIWVALLRRKVQEQTAIIREQLAREQQQNDELERKVRERTTALSQANDELQQARNELEARVRQRTGELLDANATLRDEILERQRSEQALRLSEERFSKAFQCSPIPMAISTMKEGRYIDLNDAYAQMLGFGRDEMLGRTAFELGIWADPEDRVRAVQTMQEKRRIRDWHVKLRSKDSETRHVLASAEIIVVNGVDCLLAIVNDETERVLLEEQLRQSQKMEAVGQLAAGIAHDFNNMLTIIQGHVCLLLDESRDPDQAASLTEISTTADRAAHLTRQLLTFSRRQPLMPRLLNLNEVIGGMSQMLLRTLGEPIKLQFRRALALPSVFADVTMIEQMLLNLAVNARDAMPQGGELTFVTQRQTISEDYVRSHPDAQAGEFVCITISDTGCGMDAATLSRAFEPFFTTKDVGKGTGLGLASVYGTVKQHDGWIDLESKVGQGTTFRIFLPAKEDMPAQAASKPGSGPVVSGTETILVVEDESGVRALARNVLHRCGYRVFCAKDGVQAMELWREHEAEIDLLLTDMVMPSGLSGRELAERLLSERPSLRVIYSSGYSVEFEQHDVDLKDGVNFIAKPYTAHNLAVVVRRCLDETGQCAVAQATAPAE